ncbi:MAG: hydroxysqualene dehydroxylase HpnE [Alphaproteobacteria bacterium]
MNRVFVIGAGVAGLACAIRLAASGRRVILCEATDHGGGRCRSLSDPGMDRIVDNGNHLLLSGNTAALSYLDAIGARDRLLIAPDASIPFVDLRTGLHWTVRPNNGPIPWWIFSAKRRIPGTRPRDYLAGLKLAFASDQATIADCFDQGSPAFERFWRPLAIAVLNIAPEKGSAKLLWPVLRLTFGKGAAASRPCIAREGLQMTFIDPAIAKLGNAGADIRFNRRLRTLEIQDDAVAALDFGDEKILLAPKDSVVLAIPPENAAQLLPSLPVPRDFSAIVNAHFRLPQTARPTSLDGPLLGIIGGVSEWMFRRGDVASVTVSAANALATEDAETIAAKVWPEVVQALSLPATCTDSLPPHRIIKEKRATFAQTPESLSLRPKTRTAISNLFLAGDWTDTGLPATIEGAIRSGFAAAAAIAA